MPFTLEYDHPSDGRPAAIRWYATSTKPVLDVKVRRLTIDGKEFKYCPKHLRPEGGKRTVTLKGRAAAKLYKELPSQCEADDYTDTILQFLQDHPLISVNGLEKQVGIAKSTIGQVRAGKSRLPYLKQVAIIRVLNQYGYGYVIL